MGIVTTVIKKYEFTCDRCGFSKGCTSGEKIKTLNDALKNCHMHKIEGNQGGSSICRYSHAFG